MKAIFAEVSSYGFTAPPASLEDWLVATDRVVRGGLQAHHRSRQPILVTRRPGAWNVTLKALSDRALSKACARWVDGELDEVRIGDDTRHVELSCARPLPEQTGCDTRLSFSCRRDWLAPERADSVIEELVESFQSAALLAGAVTGAFGVDYLPMAYEVVMQLDVDDRACTRYRDMARGYYWGNILSDGHLERLGGASAVIRDFPGVKSEWLSESHPRMLYLQLADSVDDVSDADLRALRTFFDPILPGGRPVEPDPAAVPPLRVFETDVRPDPEGPAFDRPEPRVDDRWLEEPTTFKLDLGRASHLAPDLTYRLDIPAAPSAEFHADLEIALRAWATTAMGAGFGGRIHSFEGPFSDADEDGGPYLEWSFDLGSAGPEALEAMSRVVSSVCADGRVSGCRLSLVEPYGLVDP